MNSFAICVILTVYLLTLSVSDSPFQGLECKISQTSLHRYWTHNNIFKPSGCIDRSTISLRQIDHGGTTKRFFYLPRNGAQRGCDYFGGMKCDITTPEQFDISSQSKLIEDSIWMNNLYGISVTLASMDFADEIQEVNDANINVFTFNGGIDDYTQTASQLHIGPDNFLAGTQACNRLLAAGATKILILNHNQFASGLRVREEGCKYAVTQNNTKTIYIKVLDLQYSAQLIAETMVNDTDIDAIMSLGPVGETSAHYALLSAFDEINGSAGFYGLTKERITNNFKGIGTFDYTQDIMDHILQYNFTKFGIDQQPYMQGVLPMCWLGIKAATSNTLLYPAKILSGPAFVDSKETIELLECIHEDVLYCHDDVDSEAYSDTHWGEIPDGCSCIDTESKTIYLFHHGGDSEIGSGLSNFYAILSSAAKQAAEDINVTLHIITDQGSNNQLDLVSYADKIDNILSNNISMIDGIITTVPNEEIGNIFSKYDDYNIPIIGIADGYDIYKDLSFANKVGSLPYIGQNDEVSGYDLSDLLYNKYSSVSDSESDINITNDALICLDPTRGSLASHKERCQGVERYCLENDLEYLLIHTDYANADLSKQAIQAAIDNFDALSIAVRGVIAVDDSSCLAAAQCLYHCKQGVLGCYDSSNIALEGIMDETVDYIFDQQPWMIGYTAMLMLTNKIFINSFPIQQIIETGPLIITFADFDTIEIKICENENVGYEFCPSNDAVTGKMDINFPTTSNFSGVLIILLFMLSFIFSFAVLLLMYYFRKETIFKTAQPFMMLTTIIGGLIMMTSALFSMNSVNTYSCNVPWIIWSLGFTVFFTSYSLRVWRFVLIIETGLSLKVRKIGYKQMNIRLFFFILIDLIISICAATITPFHVLSDTLVNGTDSQFIELTSFYCSFSPESHLSIGWVISLVYKFFILFWVISISLRKQISVDKMNKFKYVKYYEGSNIVIGIYMVAVSYGIFFLIMFSLSVGSTNTGIPSSLVWIMVSFLSFLCYVTVICCVMLHRVIHVYKRHAILKRTSHLTMTMGRVGSVSSGAPSTNNDEPSVAASVKSVGRAGHGSVTTDDFDPERIALNPCVQRAEYLMQEFIDVIEHKEMNEKDARIIFNSLKTKYVRAVFGKSQSQMDSTAPPTIGNKRESKSTEVVEVVKQQ